MATRDKAAIALGLGAAAAAIVALSGGGVYAAEGKEEPKKPPPTKKPARIVLAKRFAKLFKVPASLILATIYAQSGNRPKASRSNKRGGSWGYGQMTLATAKEIWPRAKAKIGKAWDGTGKGLLDPTINVGLTAYYLSLWWKRYGRHRLNWMLTAYAYVLGPGRVKKMVPDAAKGKLPKPLPADFARVKARFSQALKQKDVKQALAEESIIPQTSGLGSSDPLVWTPSAVKGEFDRIRNVLDTINREMSQAVNDGKMSGAEWEQWFKVYKTGHDFVDTASTYWGSNVATARQHEQEAGKWRDLMKSRGAKLQAPSGLVKQPEPGLLDQLSQPGVNMGKGIVAIGGVVAVGVLILAIKK